MKLKEIYNQVQADQNQPQINIEEVKMRFNEQISTFKQLGEGLYNLSNYKKIAEHRWSINKEIIQNRFHPKNMKYFSGWGIEEFDDYEE